MTKEQRNQWIVDNIKFIHHISKKYRNLPLYEDILQTACWGALEALKRVEYGTDEKEIRQYVAKYAEGYIMKKCIYVNKCLMHIPYNVIKDTNIRVDSIDIDVKVDDRTSTYEEIFLADIEDGYDKVETQADFDRFVDTLKPKYRDAYVTMAEVGEQKEAGQILGYVNGERVRQMIQKTRDKFDLYMRAAG